MELLSNEHFYVLLHDDNTHGLVCNRIDGSFSAISRESASELPNLNHMGHVYGIIGKYLGSNLVLIRHRNLVGTIFDPILNSEHEVYVIKNVLVLPVLQQTGPDYMNQIQAEPQNVASFKPSTYIQHNDSDDCTASLPPDIASTSSQRASSWNAFKVASALKPKMPNLNSLNSINMNYPSLSSYSTINSTQTCTDELNKRLIEEMCKLFTDTNSFYYSYTMDLTNSFQRQYLFKKERYTNDKQKLDGVDCLGRKASQLLWQDADDRFFWNQHMLQDLIDLAKNSSQDINHWILPILHGFVQLEKYNISTLGISGTVNLDRHNKEMRLNETTLTNKDDNCDELIEQKSSLDTSQYTELSKYTTNKQLQTCDISSQPNHYQLGLISRRSKYRAGTRYKRRGCDEEGNCANFVETEQIFRFGRHFVSFLLIRGSIPLFWSQPGFKYRPAPVLARSSEENFESFSKHFKELFYYYGPNHILVDCTEQNGREKVVKDAYKATVDEFNQIVPKSLNYVSFDFHKHCRGRRLLQVEQHLQENGISGNMIKGMRYFWFDSHGLICEQRGIFRINCIDCLDRTNIVQRAIALQVLDTQLIRLGLLPPEVSHESNHCRKVMQLMWANNGDILSRQYAGSNALKGDFTRTGERKFSGYIKDTYSSASRYYISKFRDAYRQAAIDSMLGVKDPLLNNEILLNANTDTANNSDSMLADSAGEEKFEEMNEDERINQMLEDCRKMIMTDEEEQVLGCWILFDCDSSTNKLSEQELLLIVTSDSYYVVDYDEATERVVNFQRVKLEQINKVELGMSTSAPIFSMTGGLTSHHPYPSLRVFYQIEDQNDFFHLFRSAQSTFPKISDDISKDVTKSPLKNVFDSIKAACNSKPPTTGVPFVIEARLTKRKSRMSGIVNLAPNLIGSHAFIDNNSSKSNNNNKGTSSNSRQWFLPSSSVIGLEPLLSNGVRGSVALRNVGSRTLDNVSNRLARLKGKLSSGSRMQYNDNNEQNASSSSRKIVNSQRQQKESAISQQSNNPTAMTCQKLSVFQRNFKCPSDTSLKQLESAIDSIDWPSSGSVETLTVDKKTSDGNNAPHKHNDDSYEDDDYIDHAMLSIDFAEIQRLKEIDLSYHDNRNDYSLPPIDYYKVLPIPEYNNTSNATILKPQEDNEMPSAQSDQVNSSSNLEMSQMISTLVSASKEDEVMETLMNDKKN